MPNSREWHTVEYVKMNARCGAGGCLSLKSSYARILLEYHGRASRATCRTALLIPLNLCAVTLDTSISVVLPKVTCPPKTSPASEVHLLGQSQEEQMQQDHPSLWRKASLPSEKPRCSSAKAKVLRRYAANSRSPVSPSIAGVKAMGACAPSRPRR
jgi:hypothetical protein